MYMRRKMLGAAMLVINCPNGITAVLYKSLTFTVSMLLIFSEQLHTIWFLNNTAIT